MHQSRSSYSVFFHTHLLRLDCDITILHKDYERFSSIPDHLGIILTFSLFFNLHRVPIHGQDNLQHPLWNKNINLCFPLLYPSTYTCAMSTFAVLWPLFTLICLLPFSHILAFDQS